MARVPMQNKTITVNGKIVELDDARVSGLLERLGYDAHGSGIAVALNGQVVPRSRWSLEPLGRGDRIDIVGAVQGG